METMQKRLFIAIKPSAPVLEQIALFQTQMRMALTFHGIRWVRPELMHLTLQFLGDTDTSHLDALGKELEKAGKQHHPYVVSFHGVAWFGRKTSIRTIWIGTEDGGETENLHLAVTQATKFLNLKNDKPFSPHLTLARVSDVVSVPQNEMITDVLLRSKNTQFASTSVTEFELIYSQLTNEGPVYKSLQRFNLG